LADDLTTMHVDRETKIRVQQLAWKLSMHLNERVTMISAVRALVRYGLRDVDGVALLVTDTPSDAERAENALRHVRTADPEPPEGGRRRQSETRPS
jgi:hypothetical protein